MIKLIFIAFLSYSCPNPEIVNHTDTPVPDILMTSFKNTCEKRYKKCVKKIVKKDEDNYWVICGGTLPK